VAAGNSEGGSLLALGTSSLRHARVARHCWKRGVKRAREDPTHDPNLRCAHNLGRESLHVQPLNRTVNTTSWYKAKEITVESSQSSNTLGRCEGEEDGWGALAAQGASMPEAYAECARERAFRD